MRATDRDDAQTRLSTYGTLAPGRPNHHHLAGLPGRWLTGQVHGTLTQAGWGADLGYPGITSVAMSLIGLELGNRLGTLAAPGSFEGPLRRRKRRIQHAANRGGSLDVRSGSAVQ